MLARQVGRRTKDKGGRRGQGEDEEWDKKWVKGTRNGLWQDGPFISSPNVRRAPA